MANLQQLIESRKRLAAKREAKLQKEAEAQKIRDIKKLLRTNITKTSKGCWEWNGVMWANGYGQVYYDGQKWRVHRLAFKLFKGELEDGMYICHRCDNPKCLNPAHLFQGLPADNMFDCFLKGRFRGKFDFGNIPHNRKLTIEQVQEIRELLTDPSLSCARIAELTGVSRFNVSDIKRGRNYAEV